MTIPFLPIEAEVASALSVSASQLRYSFCLFAALPLSWIQGKITNPNVGHIYAILTGGLLLYLPFGSGLINTIFPIISTYLCIWLTPKSASKLSWLINFPFLIIIHTINASGLKWQSGDMDITGSLMVLFLKLVSISQCRQDAAKDKALNDYQKFKAIKSCPSFLEYISYLFSFGSLLAGPYYEFTDYKDYIEKKGIFKEKIPSAIGLGFFVFLKSILYMILFIVLGQRYSPTLYFEDEFKNASLAMKYVLILLIGFTYRQKYYFAWSTSESASVFSGFGFSGYDSESNGKPKAKWDRCKNIDMVKLETADSFVKVPLYWNICTGNFLRRYVYERLTPVGKKPTFATLLITQLVSGIWHGLQPGYALMFVTSAIVIYSSKIQYRLEKELGFLGGLISKIIKTLIVTFTLNYIVIPFIILKFKPSLETWMVLLFLPHIFCISVSVFGQLYLSMSNKASNKSQ